jgi:IS5 family transposase
LEQAGILSGTDKPPATAIMDKTYRGQEIECVRILLLGQKRVITKALKAMIKRRSAMEPAIGRMKMDNRLGLTRSRARWAMPCMLYSAAQGTTRA